MKLYKLISLQIEINFSRIFKRCTNAPTLSRSECNIFSFHFPCLSGFLLICLINQRPSGPQKGCHTISTTFCGFPAKECGWWRLKPAKTTSVFFSLILALLRREGGGGKRKALIVSKKVLKRAKKSSWLWQCGREAARRVGAAVAFGAPRPQKPLRLRLFLEDLSSPHGP